MTESRYHNKGQNWIVCPGCGSEEAGMIHWAEDNEITLRCPNCKLKEWGIEWTGAKFL